MKKKRLRKKTNFRKQKRLLLLLSGGLLVLVIGFGFWLNWQVSEVMRDFVALAGVYDPPPPPPSPPSASPGTTPTPSPPPVGGSCGNGVCDADEDPQSCVTDCGGTAICENECGDVCCDGDICDADMGCWADLPPGDPGNGCTDSSHCSCSCPSGYVCLAVHCSAQGGCYSDCTLQGGPGDPDSGGCSNITPQPPSLNSPSNGTAVFSDDLTLSWQAPSSWGVNCSGNDNNYAILVDYYSPPANLLSWIPEGTTQLNVTDSGDGEWLFEPGRTYYWRVEANNGILFRSSSTWSFTMGGGVSGRVYEDSSVGECSAANPVGAPWTVSCDGVNAQKSGTDFTCVDATGDDRLDQGSHSLGITPPPGGNWIFSCDPQVGSVTLGQTTPNVSDYDIMVTQGRAGWFQTQGGDVHADSSGGGETINSQIPNTCSGACDPVFSLPDTNSSQPGTVSRASGTQDLDSGDVSSESWQAQAGSYEGLQADYQFWHQHLAEDFETTLLTSGTYPGSGIWETDGIGTFNIDGWSVSSGEQVVVVHDGNVEVLGNVNVDIGGSLMVVASGSITLDDSVGGDVTQVEGVFIADTITTGTTAAAFVGEGTFIAWSGFTLGRDLGAVANRTQPAETFVYRPDIVYNLPSEIKRPFYTWHEVQ